MIVNYTNRVNKEMRRLINMAIPYYLTKLELSDSIRKDLVIIIFIRHDESRGSCEHEISRKSPRVFDIILNPHEETSIFQTLAHELVHLVQFATGRLKMFTTVCRWNGVKWKAARNEMGDYYDSPWEIEGFGREEGLYIRFLLDHENEL